MDIVRDTQLPRSEVDEAQGHVGLAARFLLCALCSLSLHVMMGLVLDLPPMGEPGPNAVITLDLLSRNEPKPQPLATSAPAVQSRQPEPVPTKEITPNPPVSKKIAPRTPVKPVVRRPAPKTSRPKPQTVAAASSGRTKPVLPATTKADPRRSASSAVPVLLNNESGQDALKHGSEARFMHGLATEEFVEENYVGTYRVSGRGRVWIEDDRAVSGRLILHDEQSGFCRPLYRFNRFIYVYGETPDKPSPVLGSVTFVSDGSMVHQFIWQHNSTQAYYPLRQ